MCETYNLPIKRREDPQAYFTGFSAGLESSLRVLRNLKQTVAFDPELQGDFGDGVRAGLTATIDSIAKSLASFRTAQALFNATGMPPRPPEN